MHTITRQTLFLIISDQFIIESLVLHRTGSTILIQLLSNLTCLPRLFSLTTNISYGSTELSDIYLLIFTLLKQKYFKCSTQYDGINISLPFSRKNQFSTIEHLTINHFCTFNELSAILSYIPQFHHLKFSHGNDDSSIIGDILPIRLSNFEEF